MRTHPIALNVKFRTIILAVALAIVPAAVVSAQTERGTEPEVHVCGLLTALDVAPIVGARQTSQETKSGTTCVWGEPGNDPSKPRLLIQVPAFALGTNDPMLGGSVSTRARMEASFRANRKQTFDDKSAQAKDEPRLGKNAFSALTGDGVEIVIMEKNRLLNIQFMTGKRGTSQDLDAIRRLARRLLRHSKGDWNFAERDSDREIFF
jgi:hypothetical protein